LRWSALALILAATSAVALTLIGLPELLPSYLREPLWTYVQPGTAAWWFAWGGPFRSGPTSVGGMAFAALANAGSWSALIWLGVAIVRIARRLGKSSK
jgi:hypothetical protein